MVRKHRNSLKDNSLTRATHQFTESPHINLSMWGQMTSSCLTMWTCKASVSHNLPISLKAKIHSDFKSINGWNIPFDRCHITSSHLTWTPELNRIMVCPFLRSFKINFSFFNTTHTMQEIRELQCFLAGRDHYWKLLHRCSVQFPLQHVGMPGAGLVCVICPWHSRVVRLIERPWCYKLVGMDLVSSRKEPLQLTCSVIWGNASLCKIRAKDLITFVKCF